MLLKMRRRGRPAKRRVPAELSTPVEEHIDESVNVTIPPPVPLEPSHARPSHPPEQTRVNIPLDQMVTQDSLDLRPQDDNAISVEGFIEGSADGVLVCVTDVDSQDILQRNVHS